LAASGEDVARVLRAGVDIVCHSFRAPEALFQPSMIGLEEPGIHQTT
jgi:hypothetical protein